MSDNVFFIADEIEGNFHWVHCEIEISNSNDLIDLYHAAYMTGYESHSN
jgi:hypothetical protein